LGPAEGIQAAVEKYAHFTKRQFPNFGQYESWAGADLMIKGSQMARPNWTRAAVIKDVRGLKGSTSMGRFLRISTTPRTSGTTRRRHVPGS